MESRNIVEMLDMLMGDDTQTFLELKSILDNLERLRKKYFDLVEKRSHAEKNKQYAVSQNIKFIRADIEKLAYQFRVQSAVILMTVGDLKGQAIKKEMDYFNMISQFDKLRNETAKLNEEIVDNYLM